LPSLPFCIGDASYRSLAWQLESIRGPGFGFEEGHGHSSHRALALLQALPLATSGNLGTQVNTMA
jgi:hypothetical protein